ncbi:MAG: hypothetical protein HY721_16695 [Planctomycetes bacterium]|nr:hypothetical protein [Planctomycetota bacterium]
MLGHRTSVLGALGATASALLLALCQPLGAQDARKENLDLPYNAVADPEEEEDAPELVVFYGQALEADAFVFVVAKHTRMGLFGSLDIAKGEVTRAIGDLSSKGEFGVVFIDDAPEAHPPSGGVARATERAKADGADFVRRQEPGVDWACLIDAFLKAFEMLRHSTAGRKLVVYAGDGNGFCREGGHYITNEEYLERALSRITAANTQSVRIDCIKTDGSDPDSGADDLGRQFLQRLAAANRGTYRRITLGG